MYDFQQSRDNTAIEQLDSYSLCYEIKTDDVYQDMKKNKQHYDFSEYPEGHSLYDVSNKKVAGKFKDKTSSKVFKKIVGLRSKMYSYRTDGEHVEKKANQLLKEK